MYQFSVPDMTCGHCASMIVQAVKNEDPQATIEFDMARRTIKVHSTLERADVARCVADAGYTPRRAEFGLL